MIVATRPPRRYALIRFQRRGSHGYEDFINNRCEKFPDFSAALHQQRVASHVLRDSELQVFGIFVWIDNENLIAKVTGGESERIH